MPKRSADAFFSGNDPQLPILKERNDPSEPVTEHSDLDLKMVEFEGAWEDDLPIEGMIDSEQSCDEDEAIVDDTLTNEEDDLPPTEAYILGQHILNGDETLEPDESVYDMRHSLDVRWPCLSFDILHDHLGDGRELYPATVYIVAGTQADLAPNNEIHVFKMSSLYRTRRDNDDSSDDDDLLDESVDDNAVLESTSIPHYGTVNRIRAQPIQFHHPVPSHPYYVATWADTGKVSIWDIRPLLQSLDTYGSQEYVSRSQMPKFTVLSHGSVEGYALSWGSFQNGDPSSLRLLTGDVQAKIYLTVTKPSGFHTLPQPFSSHTASVEDLQWSPSEVTVFASCSSDQSIRVWDVRLQEKKSVLEINAAHPSDVNVLGWNKGAAYLIGSGGDEGGIRIWDLRNVSNVYPPVPTAAFNWHQGPITSIEWHPTESSVLVASGVDDQVTLWDLSVEEDNDDLSLSRANIDNREYGSLTIPPQLLFVHLGQRDIKEVHWHPQIPGMVISTALSGFNVFKTVSI